MQRRKIKTERFFVYKFWVSCQHALITTVNLHFKKAKQLTVSNAFSTEDFIWTLYVQFGTKFIIALSDVFKKIARTGRFYFEKRHRVTCKLFKWGHWFLRNDLITNFFKWQPPLFFFSFWLWLKRWKKKIGTL
jgi:hypothetical protein